jgi:hypothetical protein
MDEMSLINALIHYFSSFMYLFKGVFTIVSIYCYHFHNGWRLRNIHISNDNESFTFYVDVFFPLSLPRHLSILTIYIWVTRRVSYKKQELLTLRKHLSSLPYFGGVREGYSESTRWKLFWEYMMKVILRVPDEGYSESTWWWLFWEYLMKVILRVPDEGYSESTWWWLFWEYPMMVILRIKVFR